MNTFYAIALSLVSLFLILLVLVQRGRGGGLTGALGGMGGQSAFGTKAGDTFTRVTVVTAVVWISMSILAVLAAKKYAEGPLGNPDALPLTTAPSTTPDTGTGVADILGPPTLAPSATTDNVEAVDADDSPPP